MKPSLSQQVEITIERLGVHGEGVASYHGFTLFVEGALPQERVRARVTSVRKNFGRAEILERLTSSPHRVTPVCPLFGRCGGCQIMHLSYEEQLAAKRQRVVDALQRIAKIDVEVLPCIPSPKPLAYRNKIQLPVGENLRLGLYARHSHDLIEMEKCAIHTDLGEKVLVEVQRLLKKHEAHDVKHLLLKTAVKTGQVLLILVTRSASLLTKLAEEILQSVPEVKGVVQNIHPEESNVILSSQFRPLAGQEAIEESLCGFTFKVSPASFFQVNPEQAEALYQKVVEYAELTGKERVLDAYCGVGTLSLVLARAAKEVVGVESVAFAIADARENAKRNKITNVEFICGRAEESVSQIKHADVAVLNPPRGGCESAFLDALVKFKPRRIVYVSCDPATLARDLQILTQKGYTVKQVQPFDMFPQTMHVETVTVCESLGPFGA